MAAFKNAKIFKTKVILLIVCFLVLAFLIVNNFTSIKGAFLGIINQKQTQIIISKDNQELKEFSNHTYELPNKENKTVKNNNFPIVISEVFGGNQNLPPFIEIYNPSPFSISLQGASIKKIKNLKETTFVSSKRFANKIIQPYSYFLITKENSNLVADIYWPKSYQLENNCGLVLYSPEKVKTDAINWGDLPQEKSISRINWQTHSFTLALPTPQKSY